MTHTAGPWRAVGMAIYGPFTPNGKNRPGAIVASVLTINRPRHLADARLIAAAPDMLAALKDYIEWGAMTGSDRDLFDLKFREAVAKAEGRCR